MTVFYNMILRKQRKKSFFRQLMKTVIL